VEVLLLLWFHSYLTAVAAAAGSVGRGFGSLVDHRFEGEVSWLCDAAAPAPH